MPLACLSRTKTSSRKPLCAFPIFALCISILLHGCGGGGGGSRGAVASGTGTTAAGAVSAKISGTIVDENGNTVSGVAITMNGASAGVSNSDGTFTADAGSIPTAGATFKFTLKKSGYFDSFPEIHISSDTVSNGAATVKLQIQRSPDSPAEATVAEVLLTSGATETITPTASNSGGLVVYNTTVNITSGVAAVTFSAPAASGTTPDVSFTIGGATGPAAMQVIGQSGAVTGSISYGDPENTNDLARFPGPFYTTSDTGDGNTGEGALITAGFVTIKLEKADGTPITQFASGTYASIRMNVPSSATNPETGAIVSPGDTIPIFVFNESTGQWLVEHNTDGSVKRASVQQDRDGSLYVRFTTTHLTTFNLDWKSELCPQNTPRIKFVDELGKPVTGATLYANAFGWYYIPLPVYDDEAAFYRAPKDITWKFMAKKGDTITELVTVTDCKNVATNSGDITLVFKNMTSGSDAQISADRTSGMAPFTVPFTGECFSTSTCEVFNWDFGDGAALEGDRYPYHTYFTPGTYNVTLTAIDASSVSHKATQTITVSPYTGPGSLLKLSIEGDWPSIYKYLPTNDGGFALLANSYFKNSYSSYDSLITYNSSGIEQARFKQNDIRINDFIQTSDQGFALAGTYNSSPAIIKLNSNRDIVWTKTYATDSLYLSKIEQTSSGSYSALGFSNTNDGATYTTHMYLLLADVSGNETGRINIKNTTYPYFTVNESLTPTKDGGHLITYEEYHIISKYENENKFVVEKRSATAALSWSKEYPSSWPISGSKSIYELSNGDILLFYDTCNPCTNYAAVFDSYGQVVQTKNLYVYLNSSRQQTTDTL